MSVHPQGAPERYLNQVAPTGTKTRHACPQAAGAHRWPGAPRVHHKSSAEAAAASRGRPGAVPTLARVRPARRHHRPSGRAQCRYRPRARPGPSPRWRRPGRTCLGRGVGGVDLVRRGRFARWLADHRASGSCSAMPRCCCRCCSWSGRYTSFGSSRIRNGVAGCSSAAARSPSPSPACCTCGPARRTACPGWIHAGGVLGARAGSARTDHAAEPDRPVAVPARLLRNARGHSHADQPADRADP